MTSWRSRGIALAAAAALGAPGLALADPPPPTPAAGTLADAVVSLDFTSVVEVHEDRDAFAGNDTPREADTAQRLELRASNAGWRAASVVTAYAGLGVREGSRRDVVDLEELSAGGPLTPSLRVHGGDFRPRFGRGLVLDLGGSGGERLAPATTLRGARADMEVGPLSLTALGGVVHMAPLDPLTEMVLEPRDDALGGARVALRPADGVSVDVHGVAASLAPPEGIDTADARLGGVALEITPARWGTSLYAEGALQSLVLDGRSHPGRAALVAIDQTVGPISVLLEGKSYEQFDFASLTPTFVTPPGPPPLGGWPGPPVVRYHAPPSLEGAGESLPTDVNTLGGRATATVRVTSAVTVEAAYAGQFLFAARGDEPRDFGRGTRVQHPYGEARVALPGSVDVAVGGGASRSVDAASGDVPAWTNHLQARTEVPVSAQASIAAQAEWRRRLHLGREFTTAGIGVALSGGNGSSVAVRYDWSDEVPDPDQGGSIVARRHFVALEARGRLRALELFGLVGSTPGGLRCVDGACRNVPPFVGARLGARVRF